MDNTAQTPTATYLHSAAQAKLPPPLVTFGESPVRWAFNKILLLGAAVVLAYIGMLAFAGLYYLLFEVNPTMTHLWHTAVSNDSLRHSIRNHGEGLFGGLFGVAAIWNHYRKVRPLKPYDRLEIKYHIPNFKDNRSLSGLQLLSLFVLVPLYAIPGYLGTEGVVYLIHHVPWIWSQVDGYWMSSFDEKLVGYGAAFFFGRRPAKAVFDDLQLWVAERIIALPGPKLDYWWMLPTLRARCNELRATAGTSVTVRHSTIWTLSMGLIAAVVVVLAATGAYVLLFIA